MLQDHSPQTLNPGVSSDRRECKLSKAQREPGGTGVALEAKPLGPLLMAHRGSI